MTDWIKWVLDRFVDEAEAAESWAETVEWVVWPVGTGGTAAMAGVERGEGQEGEGIGRRSEREGVAAAGKWTPAAGKTWTPADRVTDGETLFGRGQGRNGSGMEEFGVPSKIMGGMELAEGSGRAAGFLADVARRRAVAEYAGRRSVRQEAPVVVRVEPVAETGMEATALDRIFQRDARRYDGGFSLY